MFESTRSHARSSHAQASTRTCKHLVIHGAACAPSVDRAHGVAHAAGAAQPLGTERPRPPD
eukprot:1694184-Pleurochrysis_carterae.AAC.1